MTAWSRHDLSGVCQVIMGQAPPGEAYNDEGKGYPLLAGAGDFNGETPAPKKFTTTAAKLSKAGDVIVGVRASIGDAVRSDGIYCLGRGVAALRAGPKMDNRFLWHWLASVKPELMHRARGATFRQVNRDDIASLPVDLPPLPEQRRIATILDQADVLRAKRRAALAHLDELAQAVFVEMFGELEPKAVGRRNARIEDLAEIQVGFAFSSSKYTDDGSGVRLCRGANVLPARIDWSDIARWPSERSDDYKDFALQAADVVVALDRPWISEGFKVAQIRTDDLPALLVQRVARLRARTTEQSAFLYYLLKSPAFQRHCRPTETTVPHISPRDVRSFTFPAAPEENQRMFGERISCINQIQQKSEAAATLADSLFDSLQHRAFNGEL